MFSRIRKEDLIKEVENFLKQIKEQINTKDTIVIDKPPLSRIRADSKHIVLHDGIVEFDGSRIKITADSERGATYLLRLTLVLKQILQNLKNNRTIGVRELYYLSSSWSVPFASQSSLQLMLYDLEIMFGVPKDMLTIYSALDKKVTLISGDITIRYKTHKGIKEVNYYEDVDRYGAPLPFDVDEIEIVDHNIEKIIAVETDGMFRRLVEENYHIKNNILLVHLGGQPARYTRRFLKIMNEEYEIPVYVFNDCDAFGYRIYAVIRYGSLTSSHISHILACKNAEYIGVTSEDIVNYKLKGERLTKNEINHLRAMLKDPRFKSEFWQKQINLMLKLNKSAEQQALVEKGLDFPVKYLDEKLS